jgi:hypothetical protein
MEASEGWEAVGLWSCFKGSKVVRKNQGRAQGLGWRRMMGKWGSGREN